MHFSISYNNPQNCTPGVQELQGRTTHSSCKNIKQAVRYITPQNIQTLKARTVITKEIYSPCSHQLGLS